MLAATSAGRLQGALLLVGYTLGLGIPFILIAAFYDRSQRLMAGSSSGTGAAVSLVGGLLVAAIGFAMIFDWLVLLPRYFQFVPFAMTDAIPRIEAPVRAEPAAAAARRSSARSPGASCVAASWAWSCSRRGVLTLVTRPIAPGPARSATPLPGATPFLVGAPIARPPARQPGARASTVTHDGTGRPSSSRTSTATRSGSRTCAGKLVWLNFWAQLVPAVPGRDAGPARPRRGVRRQGPRDRRRRRPGDDARQRAGRTPSATSWATRSRSTPRPTSSGCTGSTPCRRRCSSGRTGTILEVVNGPLSRRGRAGADRRLAAEGLGPSRYRPSKR